MTPLVIGVDLSLTATGIAFADQSSILATTLKGIERLAWFRDWFRTFMSVEPAPALVVIEEYAFHGHGAHSHQLGELGGVVRLALHDLGVPWVPVIPSTLKKYATGRGNAPKVEMVTTARERLGYTGHDDNGADALWLRAMGRDALGAPLVQMPKANREALLKVAWPAGLVEAA